MPNPKTGKIGLSELPLGLLGKGGVAVQSYDIDVGAVAGAIAQGDLRPDNLGLTVWNASGSTIPAGSLLYISGWNAAANMAQVSLATANTLATAAQWVALAAIANGAQGLVGKHLLLTGQNTNAANVGDMVYLSGTAGGYAMTSAPATEVQQVIGQVTVKSATVGVINIQLLDTFPIRNDRLDIYVPLISTAAGAYVANGRVHQTGVLIGASFVPNTALAANDTNFISFAMTDGATALLADNTGGRNTTKATGGAALVQSAADTLTIVPSLTLTAGDIVTLTATVSGTLANAVNGGVASLVIFPT